MANALPRQGQIAWVLAGAAFLIPAVVAVDGLAAAPILAVVAVALLVLAGPRQAFAGGLSLTQWLVLAAALVWGAITIAWTPAPPAIAIRSLASTAGTMIAGVVVVAVARRLDVPGRRKVASALMWGIWLGLAVVLAAVLYSRIMVAIIPDPIASYPYRFMAAGRDRGEVAILVLLWPALAELVAFGRRRAAWALGIGATVVILVGVEGTVKAALLAGLVVLWLGLRAPRVVLLLGTAGMLLIILVSPFAAERLPEPAGYYLQMPVALRSLHHRFTIWRFTAQAVMDRPIVGHGMEASRILGGDQVVVLPDHLGEEPVLPLHPHNNGLQIWLEWGAIGIVLLCLFLGGIVGSLRRSAETAPRFAVASGAALVAGGFIIAEASFGIWQSWWLATLWLGAAYLAGALSERTR